METPRTTPRTTTSSTGRSDPRNRRPASPGPAGPGIYTRGVGRDDPGTRFPRSRNPGNPIDTIYSDPPPVNKSTGKKKTTTTKKTTAKPVKVVDQPVTSGSGFQPKGQFYVLEMTFSLGLQSRGLDGTTDPSPPIEPRDIGDSDTESTLGRQFGNPLVNPRFDCQYHIMVKITQVQLPLISGFRLHFHRPKGWQWTDGYGDYILLAVVLDTAFIIRTAQTPKRPEKGYQHYKKNGTIKDDDGHVILTYHKGDRVQTPIRNDDGDITDWYDTPEPTFPLPIGRFTCDVLYVYF